MSKVECVEIDDEVCGPCDEEEPDTPDDPGDSGKALPDSPPGSCGNKPVSSNVGPSNL